MHLRHNLFSQDTSFSTYWSSSNIKVYVFHIKCTFLWGISFDKHPSYAVMWSKHVIELNCTTLNKQEQKSNNKNNRETQCAIMQGGSVTYSRFPISTSCSWQRQALSAVQPLFIWRVNQSVIMQKDLLVRRRLAHSSGDKDGIINIIIT